MSANPGERLLKVLEWTRGDVNYKEVENVYGKI